MKDFFRGILVVTAALMIFPMIPYLIGAISPAPEVKAVEAEAGVISAPESAVSMPEEVNIYDTVSESVITLSAEEFVASALAAQLSAEAEPELLKAQAVLMYTYIFRRRIDERVSPTPSRVWKVKGSSKRRIRIFVTFRESKACMGWPISSIR